ncbi:BolA family transcriptional regulator [Aliiroseovarius sp. KMU-50]|uniref:BolA family transcriptional regulator n=1 Tax=Aliiroseovarius salicola TaxID=3009082 RepID=A0ABT4W1P8_9RHOB|nr:BolA family protein [Aliiroseovarius sp. KMU-50]MDA5094438.1 BolA family transcriptional regulator [Aliiroseovarius sp. KMU-50]
MTRRDDIFSRLEATFAPQHLEVIDESEKHRGHAGYQEGGESHFRVVIHAQKLAEMSRIARHRAVHQAIGENLLKKIHALALDIRA